MDPELPPPGHYAWLSSLTIEQKAVIVDVLCHVERLLLEAGIRFRHPNADPHEVKVRMAVRMYGRELMKRHFGQIPDDAK